MTSKRALLDLFRTNFKAANSAAFSQWQIGVGATRAAGSGVASMTPAALVIGISVLAGSIVPQ
jgi:hypothetical protein